MKKILFTLLLGISSMLAQQAAAQVVGFVTHPTPVRGNYLVGAMGTSWGISIDTVLVSGRMVVGRSAGGTAAGDSLGCDTLLTNASAIAGKIAVLYRGSCEFGVKALAAQRAGAIGIVIINNAAGVIPMGPGGVGSTVTIPTVMISNSDGAVLRPFIDSDSTAIVIGNKLGFFNNDLGFTTAELIRPTEWAIPFHQIAAPGSYTANLGAEVVNYGKNPRTNLSLNVQISFDDMTGGTPSVVYNQTTNAASIAVNDTVAIRTPSFDPSTFGKGLYSIRYAITSDGVEDFDADNIVSTTFMVTDSMYSKGRLDTAFLPIATGGNRPASTSGAAFEMGNSYFAGPAGNQAVINRVHFQAVANATFTLANETMVFTAYEWADADSNGVPGVAELIAVGEGFYTYTANDGYIVKTIDVENISTSSPGLRLQSNTDYVFTMGYTGLQTDIFIGSDNQVTYRATTNAVEKSIAPFFVGAAWGSGFVSGTIANFRIDMAYSPTSVEDLKRDIRMNVYPNPAKEEISVKLAAEGHLGAVNFEIRDMAGRVVKAGVHHLDTEAGTFKTDLAGLNPGMYFMHVNSARGANTMKFIVR